MSYNIQLPPPFSLYTPDFVPKTFNNELNSMKTIGIIGGGQLGLMIVEQAQILGAKTICLDPASDAPAFKICDEQIIAKFDDERALEELCQRSNVVTYEFENIPGDLLISLEKKYNIKQGFRPLFSMALR